MAIIGINRSVVPIPRDECLRLLADNEVGRLAVTVDGQPAIYPVNYVADGDVVVFRSDANNKFHGAAMSRVAFEVDHLDTELKQGWSVVVQGVGRDISDAIDPPSELRRTLPLEPWAPGDNEFWIEIFNPEVWGQRLSVVTASS
jgi:nitroimidazol reductase NimA-like FMN-containing flavoprotein (pyridoxamine 5'-phosphate oxidase superfamily)